MRLGRTAAPALGLYYAAVFAGSGVSSPYMPVWFKAHGLSGAQIGAILATPMLARIVTGPAVAIWADGFQARRTVLAWLGLGAAAFYGAVGWTNGFWPWALLWFAGATLAALGPPLADVMTLRLARREGFAYGVPRGLGSAGFVAGNVFMGLMLTRIAPTAILVWITAFSAMSALAARYLVPPEPVHLDGGVLRKRDRFAGLRDLVADRRFMLVVLSTAAIQATHAFYYSFSAIAWRAQGISAGLVGLLWAFGVVIEIGFLWFMEPLRRRLTPESWVLLGGVAALVRWTAFAFSPPLWLLFPLQALHALTFTATFIAALQLVERSAPAKSASAAQTVSSALSSGLLIGLATAVSGPLYDRFGPMGYLAMTALAVLGLTGAIVLFRSRERA